MENDRAMQRSLLATLNYFDLFDHPLTLLELERYRYDLHDDPHDMLDNQDVFAQISAIWTIFVSRRA